MKPSSFSETNSVQVIVLDDKRQLLVDTLLQHNTYGGLHMGVADKSVNDRSIRWAMEGANSYFGSDSIPFIIPPKLLSFSVPQQRHTVDANGEPNVINEPFTRIGMRLPRVTCISSLKCSLPLAEPKGIEAFFS